MIKVNNRSNSVGFKPIGCEFNVNDKRVLLQRINLITISINSYLRMKTIRLIGITIYKKLKQFARTMKTQITALYLASRDPAVPRRVKWLVIAVVAYALSPIDLIPDFIPIIGYLDELLILPLGIYIAVKLIPDELWKQCLTKAENNPIQLPKNRLAAAAIISCWIVVVAGVGYGLWYWLTQ